MDIGEKGSSSEKMSMYKMTSVHPVSTQSGHSMFLIKNDLHEGNGSFPVEGCCQNDVVCWKDSQKSLSENLV